MSYQLRQLATKKQIDSAIKDTEDKVLLLRFGKESDPVTMQLDNTVSRVFFSFGLRTPLQINSLWLCTLSS